MGPNWVWFKTKPPKAAGFSPCVHVPGFRFGYLFLTHSQLTFHAPNHFGQEAAAASAAVEAAEERAVLQLLAALAPAPGAPPGVLGSAKVETEAEPFCRKRVLAMASWV